MNSSSKNFQGHPMGELSFPPRSQAAFSCTGLEIQQYSRSSVWNMQCNNQLTKSFPLFPDPNVSGLGLIQNLHADQGYFCEQMNPQTTGGLLFMSLWQKKKRTVNNNLEKERFIWVLIFRHDMPRVIEPYLWGQTYSKTGKKAEEILKSKKKIMEKRHGGVNMFVFSKKQSESEKGPRKTAFKDIPQ